MAFNVGDIVRLTGEGWDGAGDFPEAGTEHEVIAVYDGIARLAAGSSQGGGGYVVLDPEDDNSAYGGSFVRDWSGELVRAASAVDQDSPLQIGDKVRLLGEAWNDSGSYPDAGTIVTVDDIREDGTVYAGAAKSITTYRGERYDNFAYEVVERAEAPKAEPLKVEVGGKVKLTGSGWDGQYDKPRTGDVVEITHVQSSGRIAWIQDQNWAVYTEPEGEHFSKWGGEVVAEAPRPEPEPLADWERELLEHVEEPRPVYDVEGYPVGTPRSEKSLPSTQQIKGDLKDLVEEVHGNPEAALRQFNRWYSAEVEEFRQEGFAAGYEQARAELEATLPTFNYVVFVAPFEQFSEVQDAEDRVNALLETGRYATILQGVVDPSTGSAVGFQVNAPTLGVAEPGQI